MADVGAATVEIVRNQLHDIAQEMQATVMRCAYSPLWQEAGDLSCALLSADAEIVGQSERAIPVHIATMSNSVHEAVMRTGGYDDLHPDDVLFQNDPYAGNNHLPDFVMAQPVFADSTLVGFSAVRAHWVDVGGSTPTSYTTATDEIIEEGIRVPPAKLFEKGERNDPLVEVILANTRGQDERRGDMNAQIAGVRRGHERFEETIDNNGPPAVLRSIEQILDNDEKRMQQAIDELPRGSFTAEDYLDGDGFTDELVTIRATVEVTDAGVVVDFDGTDPQARGGVNSSRSCTEAGVHYAFKVTLDPGAPGTSGSYRPIDVRAPDGTVVNPTYPGSVVAGNAETASRIYEVVVLALSKIDPELAFAAGEGSANVFNYRSRESGEINYTCSGGGLGAGPDKDGVNAIRSSIGNTGVQPIEREEADYDFVEIESFSIVPDSGGAGQFRGGHTTRRITRFDHDAEILIVADRARTQPFGLSGGDDGASARHVEHTPDGESSQLSSKTTKTVPAGSAIEIQPAAGGGFGNPLERPPEAVLTDVIDGYVSVTAARDEYGVAVIETQDGYAIDSESTRELREREDEGNDSPPASGH